MGRYTTDQVQVYVLVIVLCTFFSILQARSLRDHRLIHKNIDSRSLLQKLRIHISNHKQVRDISEDRLSPAGPDPQHNGRSPPRK